MDFFKQIQKPIEFKAEVVEKRNPQTGAFTKIAEREAERARLAAITPLFGSSKHQYEVDKETGCWRRATKPFKLAGFVIDKEKG
tara:strand:+ start:51 stop:302 length:252 start_codon:yes stop_codon:yes gene_type:complete